MIEKNVDALVLIVCQISFGALVEIATYFKNELFEYVEKPTRLLCGNGGRDIYIREDCNVCHSQMNDPFRSETERYDTTLAAVKR